MFIIYCTNMIYYTSIQIMFSICRPSPPPIFLKIISRENVPLERNKTPHEKQHILESFAVPEKWLLLFLEYSS
jgi:hypothetical protein